MGGFVTYKKDDVKIVYKVVGQKGDAFKIEGVNYRKKIIAQSEDLEKASRNDIELEEKEKCAYYSFVYNNKRKKMKIGTVLHCDSDLIYINKCVDLYKKVGVYCYPVLTEEKNLVENLKNVEASFFPDVVVLTGHDFFKGGDIKKIDSYENSIYFLKAIKEIKKKYPSSIIIAGACQSNFEALIASGAHFASSPKRLNVHIFDPAIIAIEICVTSFRSIVDMEKVAKHIKKFKDSFGGVEVYGKMRMYY